MSDAVLPDLAEAQQLLEKISTPEDLRALLDTPGLDDATINEFVAAADAQAVLDRVFALMGQHFVAERAGGDGGVVQWDVATPSGVHTYHLTIEGGTATGTRGAVPQPRMTLAVSTPTLLRICAGRLDPITGFTTGKIKLTGDMMFGAKMSGWCDY